MGSIVNKDLACTTEVKTRMNIIKEAFNKKKDFEKDLDIRKRFLTRCWTVILYRAKTWTLKKVDKRQLRHLCVYGIQRLMSDGKIDKILTRIQGSKKY